MIHGTSRVLSSTYDIPTGTYYHWDPEIEEYSISIAVENVGLTGFENSLWRLVAAGDAWDIL